MKKSFLMLTLLSASLAVLPAFAQNRCLQQLDQRVKNHKLDLSFCQLQDNDMQTVVTYIKQHPSINKLSLLSNDIHSSGAVILSTAAIKSLNLDENALDDAGVTALANNATLTHLSLRLNDKITDQGAITLAKSKN